MRKWVALLIVLFYGAALFGGCAFNYKSSGSSFKVNAGENPNEPEEVTAPVEEPQVKDAKPE